ncbi:TPA: hypothetical protein ACG5JQ_003096 [Stenotrophomonas maltophilia]|uniref:Uncharacterized protein n=1 Tax=Stenotrophomonas maltophilia TaxID=40324 RepID=A0AAI9CDF0_STEMA|nr:hypothetical protein [Stenotrophomonas maltophilia]EKT4442629.1 hypothetical protein [Stenotrophomonas maltophilia]MBN5012114.1 hypothetical protein [Stenotrophomonas maltophilia]MCI1130536.1 hypothetical protein [Stenotrophomonas maltophilia]HDS1306444.1 hypothetical protein [Stenotrophomonas maltophilia]HDS1823645.1 hypothetical protein [Stenotrophomonas maltophilia]
MVSLKHLGLAALLAPCSAMAAAEAASPAELFDLHAQVIVHGDALAQKALAAQLEMDDAPAFVAALTAASQLDEAPELAGWPAAAQALRERQASAQCKADGVSWPQGRQGDVAEVAYRCHLPDLSGLLPVYRQHRVPFNGPHPPEMSAPLAAAYTTAMHNAPDRVRSGTLIFQRTGGHRAWRVRDPSPLIALVADAFLPFFEWNEHLPDDAD